MLGMHGGVLGETSIEYELQDFTMAKWCLIASVSLLFFSLLCLGFYRVTEFMALRKGKVEIIKELSKKERAKKGKDKNK